MNITHFWDRTGKPVYNELVNLDADLDEIQSPPEVYAGISMLYFPLARTISFYIQEKML